jgi:hypothetical protein
MSRNIAQLLPGGGGGSGSNPGASGIAASFIGLACPVRGWDWVEFSNFLGFPRKWVHFSRLQPRSPAIGQITAAIPPLGGCGNSAS